MIEPACRDIGWIGNDQDYWSISLSLNFLLNLGQSPPACVMVLRAFQTNELVSPLVTKVCQPIQGPPIIYKMMNNDFWSEAAPLFVTSLLWLPQLSSILVTLVFNASIARCSGYLLNWACYVPSSSFCGCTWCPSIQSREQFHGALGLVGSEWSTLI